MWISTQRHPLQTWMSVETTTTTWVLETNPLRRPHYLNGHWNRPLEPDESSAQSDLCCSPELNHVILVSSGQRRIGPPTKPGFSQGFFSPFLSLMEFWFLATVAFGLLSWGHLISGNIVSLIAQILFEENWTELDDESTESLNQQWTDFNWKIDCYCFLALLTHCFPV